MRESSIIQYELNKERLLSEKKQYHIDENEKIDSYRIIVKKTVENFTRNQRNAIMKIKKRY